MNGFSLIETMRYEPGTGIIRQKLHHARLRNSARVLGFSGMPDAWSALEAELAGRDVDLRVRLELFADGRHAITSTEFQPLAEGTVWTVRIARAARLSSGDPILRHKTSRREIHDAARAEFARDEADEVLLLNERDEVCEGTITNLFVDDGTGGYLTPPLASGCLAGILRTSLICGKRASNRRLTVDDLTGKTFYLGNSLRGLITARLA